MKILLIEKTGVMTLAYILFKGRGFDKIYYISGKKPAFAPQAEKIDIYSFKGAISEVNKNSLEICDKFMELFENDEIIARLKSFAGDPMIKLSVIKFYFYRYALTASISSSIVRRLTSSGNSVIFLTSKNMFLEGLKGAVLPFLSYTYTFFKALFIRRIGRASERVHKIGMPIAHGFSTAMPWSDAFILDMDIVKKNEILFIKESWDGGKDVKGKVEEAGATYTEADKTKVCPDHFFKRILCEYGKFCMDSFFLFLKSPRKRSGIMDCVIAAAMGLVWDEAFFSNYRIKIYVVRDEYSPRSITKTIALHKYGGKTVGFMHSDYNHPYISPGLATYLYLDYYCVYGDAYKDAYSKYWDGVGKVATIGILRNDKLYRLFRSQQKDAFSEKVSRLRRDRFLIAVFAGTLRKGAKEEARGKFLVSFYKGIIRLAEAYPNVFIVIKRKSEDDVLSDPEVGPGLKKLLKSGSILFAPTEATYELIKLSDFIIGWRNTAVCLEAICAGKEAVFYNPMHDYVDPSYNFYRDYDKSFMAVNEEELMDIAGKYIKGTTPVKRDVIDYVRKHHDVTFDGKASERFGSIIKHALAS